MLFLFFVSFVERFIQDAEIDVFGEIFVFYFHNLLLQRGGSGLGLEFGLGGGVGDGVEGVIDEYFEVGELGEQANFVQFYCVALDEGMPEGGRVVGLEITEFFQKS